ncbi:MAG: cation acetate symporter [bacterium]|nr:cation acetate symporter [bacterium]
MNYSVSPWAIAIFCSFVITVLAISYHFARSAKSASGFYTAGGNIHWSVNGIAFAGDYLSAASFLGICGMIAFSGYDGFLYSVGYLAGWVVAMFVVAEPIKRLGKYTFTDALNAKFNSKGIQLAAAISTLLVSIFYLIPQMVGAGSLVTPLLGLPHEFGVIMVGTLVIIIVATAGMASTTYVQFLKGGLLLIFSLVLVFLIMSRGVSTKPDQGGDVPFRDFQTVKAASWDGQTIVLADSSYSVAGVFPENSGKLVFVKLVKNGQSSFWKLDPSEMRLEEAQTVAVRKDGTKLYNGETKDQGKFYQVGHMSRIVKNGQEVQKTGTTDFFSFIKTIKDGTVVRWLKFAGLKDGDDKVTVYYQQPIEGKELLKPGVKFKVDSARGATTANKIDFISLMIALFFGTAALPHVLIRYYTVPNPASARKSTIVAIAAIGLFYLLTLYMGLGAMVNGVLDLTNDNMSAPLLAKSFGVTVFAIISALAFATVLGTVSGLIIASSGAVAHDLADKFFKVKMDEKKKVLWGKLSAVGVGIIAMALGILFKGMNVSYLVGWAFAVAASANLPTIAMILFWPKTTSRGVLASILVGLGSALGMILLSQETFNEVYHIPHVKSLIPFNNPAIVSVPLSFLTLVVVSLLTQRQEAARQAINAEQLKKA